MAGQKRKQPDDGIPSANEYLAMDCEFVGAGRRRLSALGRCSVVAYDGRVVLDIYAKPDEPVTDYRTEWSGIRKADLDHAMSFQKARDIINDVLKNHIVVGHAVDNDFKVLQLNHPVEKVRDTSDYVPLRRMANLPQNTRPSLKKLTKNLLGNDIQGGEHSSVEDSQATMEVFKLVRVAWEKKILEKAEAQRMKRQKREEEEEDDDGSSTASSNSSCSSNNTSSSYGDDVSGVSD